MLLCSVDVKTDGGHARCLYHTRTRVRTARIVRSMALRTCACVLCTRTTYTCVCSSRRYLRALGVQYGLPPTGKRRFQPPVPRGRFIPTPFHTATHISLYIRTHVYHVHTLGSVHASMNVSMRSWEGVLDATTFGDNCLNLPLDDDGPAHDTNMHARLPAHTHARTRTRRTMA